MVETQDPVKLETIRAQTRQHERGTGEIRADIERTRAEMDETMNAIEKKFFPDRIRSQLKEGISEMSVRAQKTIESAGTALSTRVKRHPVPTALLAIAISWLMISFTRQRRH
jgi:hypothetical protein